MSRLRNTLRSLASGYVALGVNVLYTLGSVPLALHYLSKQEFGLWALVTQVSSYLALIDLGITGSLARNLIEHKDTRADGGYGSVIQTGVLVFLVQGSCIALGGLLLSLWLPDWLAISQEYSSLFRVLVAWQCAFLGMVFPARVFMSLLQAHQRFDAMNYAQIGQLAIGFGAQWLAFHRGWGLYSMLVASGASLVYGVGNNLSWVTRLGLLPAKGEWGRPSVRLFRDIFSFGSELFLLSLGLQLLNASQIVIITRTLGLEAAALWSIATKTFVMAQQVVGRILDFSGSAIIELVVRGEREKLRQRFHDVLLLTASAAVLVGVSVAVCNQPFLTVWTKGKISWPWWNDALMALLMIITSVTRCHIGLAGMAKQIGRMRYVYFLEGALFVAGAFLAAHWLGLAGVMGVAILANLCCSGAYGFRWGPAYLGTRTGEVLGGWLAPAERFLLLVIPLALAAGWGAWFLPPLAGFSTSAAIMLVGGVALLWRFGLTPQLRDLARHALQRFRSR